MKLDLKGLNKNQLEAVKFGDKPLLVIAGAGSGKTRVLTYRVAHLVKRGYLPSRIWVTTFTKAASEEMVERLEPLIGENKTDRLKIGTFHSLCYSILRDLLENNGAYELPKLIMGGGQWMTMVKIRNFYKYERDKWNKDANRFATKDIKALLSQISYWKNEGKRPKDVEAEFKKNKIVLIDSDPKKNPNWSYTYDGTYLQAYKDYQKQLSKARRLDFDDMLFKTYYELQKPKSEKFLERLRKRTEHILVDEAQDLNKIQFLLVKLLAGKNRKITMVGDDYQVLYGFRGARVEEIMDFSDFLGATVIKLEQNYRSTPQIVGYGNKLIKNNTVQIWKDLFTANESYVPANVTLSCDLEHEAQNIMNKIEDMIYDGYDLNDIAILYRTNAQSRAIVDQFILNHIPHKVYSKDTFYNRKEIKDMIAYMRICFSPFEAETEDFGRIINKPARFVGKKFIEAIEDKMFEEEYDSFWECLQSFHEMKLAPVQVRNVTKFVDMVERANKIIKTTGFTAAGLLKFILHETKYLEWLNKEFESEDEDPDNDTGLNMDSLISGLANFRNPGEFLTFIDSMEFEKNEEEDAIHLMTVHKSKGKEFPVVFIVGMSYPAMPHHKAENYEEERRIAYVAVTRAKEELHVSTIAGKFGRYNARPSSYIEEMGLKVPKNFDGDFPEDYEGKQIDFFQNVLKGLEEKKKPTLTKYDVKGNVVSIDPLTAIVDPDAIGKHLDKTVGEKHFETGGDGEGFLIRPAEENGEDDDYILR